MCLRFAPIKGSVILILILIFKKSKIHCTLPWNHSDGSRPASPTPPPLRRVDTKISILVPQKKWQICPKFVTFHRKLHCATNFCVANIFDKYIFHANRPNSTKEPNVTKLMRNFANIVLTLKNQDISRDAKSFLRIFKCLLFSKKEISRLFVTLFKKINKFENLCECFCANRPQMLRNFAKLKVLYDPYTFKAWLLRLSLAEVILRLQSSV